MDPRHCLTPDTIAYLFERYQIWKDQINPQALTLADMALNVAAEKAAEQADFLAYLRPGALITFTRTLAVQCVSLAAQISGASTISASATTTSSKKSASKSKPVKRATAKRPKGKR
jgi:hypothetical protein